MYKYDDAVFTRLEFQQKRNFNIEIVKNDLKLHEQITKSKARQRLFNEGTGYISATELRVFTTHCMYFKLFSVCLLPLTETYSFNDEMLV